MTSPDTDFTGQIFALTRAEISGVLTDVSDPENAQGARPH
jgi:hypothetical protein